MSVSTAVTPALGFRAVDAAQGVNFFLIALGQLIAMKAFLLAIIAVASLDAVANHCDGMRACWTLVGELVHRTQRDVSESVYRS